ncbi:MAG: alkaline phosphatase D family protein [Alphaproteobacteria bacterium]
MARKTLLTRRTLLRNSALASTAIAASAVIPARGFAQSAATGIITSDGQRPTLPYGVQTGDIRGGRAVLWSRASKPARMMVELATKESFADSWHVRGPAALEASDYTAKMDLTELPAGQKIFYRVTMVDLADHKIASEPTTGSLWTPPGAKRNIRFVWSGDTAGQGWGIDLDRGGMTMYETMRKVEPAFFIHSGDTIYADGPLEAEVQLEDGSVWKNVLIEEKAKVAESLQEFRGQYAYNLMDENVRRFNAEVPMFAQWDDHEVTNNWYPTEDLASDPKKAAYKDTSVDLLAARAAQAFFDYMPIRRHPDEPERVYSAFGYGPSLDILRIDMRTYRAPNSVNDQDAPGPDTSFLGEAQKRWLKRSLLASNATWKVIASDMPLGLVVPDGDIAENAANGDGPVKGREFDIAEILRFIRDNDIRNVVWLTADVHYTAAHYYDPNKAQFQDFAPFWEFVTGPIHAGTFGPNALDNTLGPEVKFVKAPPEGQANLPPSAGLQFFGQVDIDGDTEVMTVALKDVTGATLFTQSLTPV